ncbi:alpha-tocopherol transfer protein-like isoform X2 [Zophobas morio]|uniref:alpha-tocopherol transfer protein-like isoform X2 n=1 Tax=Zophobas morio TaxID=2755281 RepID=UPI003083ECA9
MALPFQFNVKTIIEDGRTTESDISAIKTWLKTTSLPPLQEQFIVLFLLSCSNDLASVRNTIEYYFKVKNEAPQIFNDCDLENTDMKKILSVAGFCILPRRMDNNTAVIVVKLIDTNYRNCDVISVTKLGNMLLHLSQIYDPPNEVTLVMDMKGIGLMHLTCIKMRAMLSELAYVQEGVPLKVREIHILNANYIFYRMLDLFKMFIKNELLPKIRAHSAKDDFQEFHKYVPAFVLPKEYGGELACFDEIMKGTLEKLVENQAFFKAEEEMRKFK